MNSFELAIKAAQLALEKKAESLRILELKNITPITDYFVICTGQSDVQVKAIVEHIEDTLRKEKIKIWHREGTDNHNWVLLDLIDVVIHIFLPEMREFYALEKLWGDANIIEVKDESKKIST